MILHYDKDRDTLENFRNTKALVIDSDADMLFPVNVILLGKCSCGGVSLKYPDESDDQSFCTNWIEFLPDPDGNY